MRTMNLLLALALATLAAPSVFGDEPSTSREAPPAVKDAGSDRFVAGGHYTETAPVGGDLFAAGGTIDVLAAVGGDALMAGGNLRLDGEVKQDVYATGGRLGVDAPVHGNLRWLGGTLEIGTSGHVLGNVSAAGGEVRILGPVDGYMHIASGQVFINAPVGGDVEVRGGSLALGPKAAIAGALRYMGGAELEQAPGAQVSGGIEHRAWKSQVHRPYRRGHAAGWVWTVGLMVLGAVVAAALPGWTSRMTQALRQRPGISLLVGLVALVCVPVAILLLLVTIIGAPLAVLALLIYPAMLLLGYVCTGVASGRLALQRWWPGHIGSAGWRALAAAMAVLVFSVAARVPWLGGLIAVAVLLCGIGIALMGLRRQPGDVAA